MNTALTTATKAHANFTAEDWETVRWLLHVALDNRQAAAEVNRPWLLNRAEGIRWTADARAHRFEDSQEAVRIVAELKAR